MQMLDHPNVVALKHCFFSTTDKEELYLNLVLEFVPDTVNRIARNYNRINQRMPLIYVKLYTYQVWINLPCFHNFLFFCFVLFFLFCTYDSFQTEISMACISCLMNGYHNDLVM